MMRYLRCAAFLCVFLSYAVFSHADSSGGGGSGGAGSGGGAGAGGGNGGPGSGSSGRRCVLPDSIGLSVLFQDGQAPTMSLIGDQPRYLQELDITASASTSTDQGILPIIASGDLSYLDWRGVSMVEETWAAAPDGSFTRVRYYRNAQWMTRESWFLLTPVDARGNWIGAPIITEAGRDDRWDGTDDGFIRRFDARQTAHGCRAVNDCSTASSFVAEGLVQLRDALHPQTRAVTLPRATVELVLLWSEDAGNPRRLPVQRLDGSKLPFGYGFQPRVTPVNQPANGRFYVPGEQVTVQLGFFDGDGRPLTKPGALPTYADFLAGNVPSGLHYYDGVRLGTTLYYALKHREGNLNVALEGPLDRATHTPRNTVSLDNLVSSQITVASTAVDGYTSVAQIVPSFGIILAGMQDARVWQTAVPDRLTFTIPSDALPGTYTLSIKARRDFDGQALNRAYSTEIQVGTTTTTAWVTNTDGCSACHNGRAALSLVGHGFAELGNGEPDRRACFACHAPLAIELDNGLDYRVHFVHSRSRRFPGNVNNCSTCHLTTPSGPARGLLTSVSHPVGQ